MKKLIILLPVILLACSKSNPKIVTVEVTNVDTMLNSENEAILEAIGTTLTKTETLETEVGDVFEANKILKQENKTLKQEIKTLKDSLVEVKNKLPKKQNFIQRVFNITPDSIEVVTIDTIKITE